MEIKDALSFLKEGLSAKIGALRLQSMPLYICVYGWSQYKNFGNLTHVQSLIELEEIKEIFAEMLLASPELTEFVKGRQIHYTLNFDDGGKASIPICTEINDVLSWKINIRKFS